MKLPYFALRDHVSHGGLRGSNDLFSMAAIGFGLGQSVLLVVGGPDRWGGEQFTYARQIPWSPYSWATAMLFFIGLLTWGVLLDDEPDEQKLSARGWLIVVGGMGCAFWCAAFGVCFARSGIDYPTQVSLVGPFQWVFFTLMYMVKVGQHLELKVWERST